MTPQDGHEHLAVANALFTLAGNSRMITTVNKLVLPVATILVVDDDVSMRLMMRRALQGANHIVIEAENGEVGLALFRERGADLVITDIMMPEKEGIETMREVREISPGTKIIAISGGGSSQDMIYLHMAQSFGADATLAKPFRIEKLLSTVNELLQGGSSSAGTP